MIAALRRWFARLSPHRNGTDDVVAESQQVRRHLDSMIAIRRRDAAVTKQEQMRLRKSIRTGNLYEDVLFPERALKRQGDGTCND